MRARQIAQQPQTFALIFNTGDELASELKRFAAEHNLSAASFQAVGALASVRLGWFNPETKQYEISVALEEQVELLSLIGDCALKDGTPEVHAHVVVGRRDGSTLGGHLQHAVVRPTCEVILTESPAHLQKKFDPDTGLALISI